MTNNLLTAKREKRYRAVGQYFIDQKGEPVAITLKDRLSYLIYRETTHRRFRLSAYPDGRELVGDMTAYGRKHSSASKDFFFPIFGLESRLQPLWPSPVQHGYELVNGVLNRRCLTALEEERDDEAMGGTHPEG